MIDQLKNQGVDEAEIQAFLNMVDPSQRAHALSQIRSRAFEGTTIHLPGETTIEGWQARLLIYMLSALPPPAGTFFMGLNLVKEVCNRLNITVGIGPAVGGGVVAGGSIGFGILIAPGDRIGFYGSASYLEGFIDSFSGAVQVTVVHGGPEVFGGDAVAMGGTIDLSEGPGIGIHALFNTRGQFIGVTGELTFSLGVPAVSCVEAFANISIQ